MSSTPHIEVKNLTVGYGDYILMKNISFTVNKGDIFIIMGGSGCGKSTLLHVLTGLKAPQSGKIMIDGINFTKAPEKQKKELMQRCGILYQGGALFSSMTLAENIASFVDGRVRVRHAGLSSSEAASALQTLLAANGLAASFSPRGSSVLLTYDAKALDRKGFLLRALPLGRYLRDCDQALARREDDIV